MLLMTVITGMITIVGGCVRQRKFQQDMALLNSVLDKLILNVISEKEETDLEALLAKDYDKVKDPSLLRFVSNHWRWTDALSFSQRTILS